MTFSWNQYQEALNIVKTFELERTEIRDRRRNFNFKRTYNDIVWGQRMTISNDEYLYRKFLLEGKINIDDDIFKKVINDMKTKLLETRFRAMTKKNGR